MAAIIDLNRAHDPAAPSRFVIEVSIQGGQVFATLTPDQGPTVHHMDMRAALMPIVDQVEVTGVFDEPSSCFYDPGSCYGD